MKKTDLMDLLPFLECPRIMKFDSGALAFWANGSLIHVEWFIDSSDPWSAQPW